MSQDLSQGIAVIIDDEIGVDKGDEINEIIEKIHDKGIPTCQITRIEDAKRVVNNFHSINFMIIDWNMAENIDKEGKVKIPEGALEAIHDQVIEIIKKTINISFLPIFIFTNDPKEDIESTIIPRLKKEELYFDNEERNFIHVGNKNDLLQNGKLFKKIKQWIEKSPPIYLLKYWQKELFIAQNNIFWDLFNKSSSWPQILWNNYEKEMENPLDCINENIFQLIKNSFKISNIDKKKIIGKKRKIDIDEIKDVLNGIMYQPVDTENIKPGDIFKTSSNKYWLNIRPECDTVGRSTESKKIYVIPGKGINKYNIKKMYSNATGFSPKVTEALVYFLDKRDVIVFDFRELKIIEKDKILEKRICRILPPFITNIQQRFSSFIGRFGLPRLPKEIEEEIQTE